MLKGSLYEYSLPESGAESLDRVTHSIVSAPAGPEQQIALVRVVTFDHLGEYLRQLAEHVGDFVEELRVRAREVRAMTERRDGLTG